MSKPSTVGEALRDPSSNLSQNVARARETMRQNAAVIDALVAKGMTREQAWQHALSTVQS